MRILVIDDEQDICDLFKRELLRQKLADRVDTCLDLHQGIALANNKLLNYDLVLLDLNFSHSSTVTQTCAHLEGIEVPVLIVSGLNREHIESMVGPLTKPYREKTQIMLSGGMFRALAEVVYWFKGDKRIKNIEERLNKLRSLTPP